MLIPELSERESELLTLALGVATGVAARAHNVRLANDLIELANTIHRNVPNWKPYETASGKRAASGNKGKVEGSL